MAQDREPRAFSASASSIGLAQELLVGLLQVLDESLLVRLRIMNEAAQLIQPLLAQPVKDHVNGRAFFANKQHALAARHIVRDQVGDRLRFARAGRALDDVAGARCARGRWPRPGWRRRQ